jgi:o-succinylbenzoate synthase
MSFIATHHPYILYFKQPAGTSRGVLTMRQVIFLRLADNAAPYRAGWGECGAMPGLSVDDRPDFATKVAEICAALNQGQAPETLDLTHWPAIAFGLEMALRDLCNGGNFTLYPTPFRQGKTTLPTHGLIWMDSVEGLLAQIERKVAQGYQVIKMKVGALPLRQELALLRAVRVRYPAEQISLRLDANGAFAADEALAILDQLAQFDIEFLEQPIRVGQWAALAAICRRSPIPIALDEELIGQHSSAQRLALLTTVHPQHLVLKPALLGGFQAAEVWIAQATELGITWWINSLLESNVGLNAICQWTSALDPVRVHGLGTGQLFTNNIPSPLCLHESGLRYDPMQAWNLQVVQYPYGRDE